MLPSNRIYSAALDGQATPQLTVEVLDATGSNKNMCCISVGICTAHNIWGVLKHFRNHKCGRLFNHWISFDFGSATDTWIPCMTCLASPEFFPPWGRCRSNGLPWRTSHGGCGTSPQHVFGIERNLGNAKSEWIPNLITIFLDWKLRPASEKTDLLKRWPIAFFHVSTISRCLEHSGSAWPGVKGQTIPIAWISSSLPKYQFGWNTIELMGTTEMVAVNLILSQMSQYTHYSLIKHGNLRNHPMTSKK